LRFHFILGAVYLIQINAAPEQLWVAARSAFSFHRGVSLWHGTYRLIPALACAMLSTPSTRLRARAAYFQPERGPPRLR
jgi:hypothetical protein